jgi:hypothetical protein
MQIFGKNIGIFINCPVLYEVMVVFLYVNDLPVPAVQEIYLEVKAPAFHIAVKILKIRIIINSFKSGVPAIIFS